MHQSLESGLRAHGRREPSSRKSRWLGWAIVSGVGIAVIAVALLSVQGRPTDESVFAQFIGTPPDGSIRALQTRVDRSSIDPVYFIRFNVDAGHAGDIVRAMGLRRSEVFRIQALWYAPTPPSWWGPVDPGSGEFWVGDDGKILRMLCLDRSSDTVYVKIMYY